MSEPSIDIGLGILDHQLVDSEGRRCGKVDDLELDGRRRGHAAGRRRSWSAAPVWRGRGRLGPAHGAARRRDAVLVPGSEVDEIDSAVRLAKPAAELRPRPRRRPRAALGGVDPGERAVRLSDLLGPQVRTESGDSLGRVYDVRAELDRAVAEGDGPVVGKRGLLERLGIGAPQAASGCARTTRCSGRPWCAPTGAGSSSATRTTDSPNERGCGARARPSRMTQL